MTHAELAKRNFELAPKIGQYDWRVTVFFYAAVHAANHVLFNGNDVRGEYSHVQRAMAIDGHETLKKKSARYRELLKLSITARYHAWELPLIEAHATRAGKIAEEILTFCGIITPPPAAASPTGASSPAAASTTAAPAPSGRRLRERRRSRRWRFFAITSCPSRALRPT